MTRLEYYMDFVTMPALIGGLMLTYPVSVPAFAAGVLTWTVSEYVIHRYLFHAVPLFKGPHDEHHDNPSGKTGVSSFQSLAIFVVLALLIPGWFLAGFTLGYLVYIIVHHAFHHWIIRPTDWFYAAKMRHVMHHKGVEANFGVTTTAWDRLLQTYRAWTKR